VTVSDSGRKVIFRPGGVRVSSAGVRGIVPSPPPVRTPGGGRGQGGEHGKGRGGGNSLSALALALAATSATGGVVIPSPDVPGAVTRIGFQVLSAPQATFDTATILGGNIPASYSHLEIRANLRGTNASTGTTALLTFNNDSTAGHYTQQLLEATTSSVIATAAASTNALTLGTVSAANAPAANPSPVTVEIFDYARTTFDKTTLSRAFARTNATTSLVEDFYSGLWLSTAAVTSIAVAPSAGSWDTGSSFYLYGIT
jgi:hypothetical protein